MTEAGAPVEDGVTAGALLRQAREAAGLHVATLAANLKVPVRKLEALEEDRYDLLPDAVFVRALASSVCRTLKIDAQPVLERLPQTASPRLPDEGKGINAPFRSPSDGPGPGVLDQVTRPVVLTVVALLLGALVLIFLPVAQRGYDSVTQAARVDPVMPPPGAAANVPAAPVPVESAGPAPASPAMPASASGAVPTPAAVSAAPQASVAPGVPAAAPAATSASAVAAAPASAAPSGPINASGTITFRTRGPSWIEVTDATGATVFRKLMEAGESAGASGTLPLSVVVGSVEATEVQVRGKPFNLGSVARDNVARFEVK